MVFRISLIVSFVLVASACSNFYSNQAIADSDRASRTVELDRKLDEYAVKHGITSKGLAELKKQALTIAATKERLALNTIRNSCGKEIQLYCPNDGGTSTLNCIKSARDRVSDLCEAALRSEFGGRPTIVARQHLGIPIPKGSIFLYGSLGDVRGVLAADNFRYNGIHFKKGSISFHGTGISVGRLVSDQYINGIKYLASGLGPFFNDDGHVVNATLAEDTEIGGIVYMGGQQVTFHSKGRVESGRVAQETNVQGESYIPGDRIWFDRNGAIKYVDNKINLYKPIPQAVDAASEFLGKTFVTSRALVYLSGLPRHDEVKRYIRRNSFTIYTDQADRRITTLRNSCIGCMGPDRLVTPIRVEYIPVGTSIKVTGEYLHKSESLFGSDIRILIARDEQGNSAEIPESGFKFDVARAFTGRENRETIAVQKNIESFDFNRTLRLTYCPRDSAKELPGPIKFMRDFKMEDEVDISASNALCDGGNIIEFKTLESYLTSNYYFREWGLHGKWSRFLSKSERSKSVPRPPVLKPNSCSLKLTDIQKTGNCPGPQCDLSKLCESGVSGN